MLIAQIRLQVSPLLQHLFRIVLLFFLFINLAAAQNAPPIVTIK